MDGSWSLRFIIALALSGATAWAALKATADEGVAFDVAVQQNARPPATPEPSGRGLSVLAAEATRPAAVATEPPSLSCASGSEASSEALTERASVSAPEASGSAPGGASAAAPPAPLPPDLVQTNPALKLPGGGLSYCGPVAISNGLMWLESRGFEALAPRGEDPFARQVALVRAIAGGRFMATSPYGGTPPPGVLRGLSRWVQRAGYRIKRLEYQGWRAHQAEFSTSVKQPRIEWIAEALREGGVAWLHVGWYHAKRYNPGLHRRGGHWLTVVAVEPGGGDPAAAASGEAAPGSSEQVMLLRDSAPYAGDEPTLERVTLAQLEKGWLFEGKAGLPGKGFYKVTSGLSLKRPDDVPVLDGAVVLVLAR